MFDVGASVVATHVLNCQTCHVHDKARRNIKAELLATSGEIFRRTIGREATVADVPPGGELSWRLICDRGAGSCFRATLVFSAKAWRAARIQCSHLQLLCLKPAFWDFISFVWCFRIWLGPDHIICYCTDGV